MCLITLCRNNTDMIIRKINFYCPISQSVIDNTHVSQQIWFDHVCRCYNGMWLIWHACDRTMMLNLSYSPETLNSGQNGRFFVPCDLEIWRMTLKNNRAPLLCCFKPCASLHSHQWTLTGVTVRKRPIWVKIDNVLSRVALKFDRWPWKTIGHL